MVGMFFSIFITSCSKVPDHVKYIPKNAVVVAGINLKSFEKKIAWNVITGSKLFKEMQQRISSEKNANDSLTKLTNELLSGMEKTGIDFFNTIYFYVKTDKRMKGGNRIFILVPLSGSEGLEVYLKRAFPKIDIIQKNSRKEASVSNIMFLGWTKNILLITNSLTNEDGEFRTSNFSNSMSLSENAENSAEMESAFNISKENSIISTQHFKTLEIEGHDISVWVNYEQIMNQYMNETVADKMGGLSLSNSLWKDAAFAIGIDFNKGKITADMNYYVSDEMNEIAKDFGSINADKDMIERLPKQNLDFLMAWHLSPSGLKKSIEKTGLLGLVNIGLGTQGLDVDKTLDAFTGDMAIVMNNFNLTSVTEEDEFLGQKVKHTTQKPNINMTFVLKINKKDNFFKIFNLYKDEAGFFPFGNNCYAIPLDLKDSVYILLNDNYAVASNVYSNVKGYIDGNFKSNKISHNINTGVIGHPLGMYFDIQQIVKNIDPKISNSAHDSVMIVESKKLLDNISINGGSFKNNSFESHVEISLTNKEENSLLALLDYGMKINEADKIKN